MVLYAYIERLLAELFEPFTAENLPAVYAAEYAAEDQDENTRQGRLRLYGEIHSLSREQLEVYNQLDDSEDRSHSWRRNGRLTQSIVRRPSNNSGQWSAP